MFKHTITIYNKKQVGREDVWNRTVIKGVHYENIHGIKLGDRSISTDSSTEIVVPIMDGFLKPKAYQKSNEDNVWTLAPNDKIVLGRLDIDITSERELEDYDDIRTIKSYDVIDYADDLSLNNITVVAR